MIPRLPDPENGYDYVWAETAYSGECLEDFLNLGDFESQIHEKGARNHPLSDAAKELGTPEKRTAASTRILPSSGGKAALTHIYTETSKSDISSCQMNLSISKRALGFCQSSNQAQIVIKKRRRCLRIYSAHITRNAIEIKVSAPLDKRAIFRSREYFLFPDPKHPATSLRFLWSALSCCL